MSPLESIICAEIHECGPMTFARFMEHALYHPQWGYYTKENGMHRIGRGGDFFTSVSVGDLLGRLVAQQFTEWWCLMGKPKPFYLVECGGFDAQLAYDILKALHRDSPFCIQALQYVLVEPSQRLAQHQQNRLSEFSCVHWVHSLRELDPLEGIVFGNELLDAFPVHLLESYHGAWRECSVDAKENHLTWTSQTVSISPTFQLPERYEGKIEVCLQAITWLKDACKILKQGRILLLDYGWTDEEYFQVGRPCGTVRGYYQHRLVENVLVNPGEQDLTAHVRWTPILDTAIRLGLYLEEFIQQGRWFTRIMTHHQLQLNPKEVRQFHFLTHPGIMGNVFRVLVLKNGKQV